MEEFKRLLEAFADEALDSYHSSRREDLDSHKNLLRYFEERTQRPLDWVKVYENGFRRKIFSAGRGSDSWSVDFTGIPDEVADRWLKEIHPALYFKDGCPHVPAETVRPQVVCTRSCHSSYLGGLAVGERKPFRCPICNGIGFEKTHKTPCRACKGACIVWG